jgi:hypothetical protein
MTGEHCSDILVPEYQIVPLLSRQKGQYKYLEPLGFSRIAKVHRKEKPDSLTYSNRFLEFQQSFPQEAAVLSSLISNREVGFSFERQRAQELKMDRMFVTPDPLTDYSFKLAINFAYGMYKPCLIAPVCSHFELVSKSASGMPYSSMGYPTKGAAVLAPIHTTLLDTTATPIGLNVPKGSEALPDEDLLVGKLRTVCVDPTFFVSTQKYFFDGQNNLIKLYHTRTWGKYGYVKQYGGFDRLMRGLLPYSWLYDADVSGWDRSIFLLYTYELRLRGLFAYYGVQLDSEFALSCLFDDDDEHSSFHASFRVRNPPFTIKFLRRVIYDSVFPVVAMSDGVIVRRFTGNNSGRNNTTTDNTLQHSIIAAHLVIRRFFEIHNRYPEFSEINETLFYLFGDDCCAGFPLDYFDSSSQLRDFVINHYFLHGMTVKPSAFHIIRKDPGSPFSGLSFLGSTAFFEHGLFVPYPRVGKLMYSLCCVMKGSEDTDDLLVDKILAIWDLVSPCSLLIDIRHAVHTFALSLEKMIASHENYSTLSSKLVYAVNDRINWQLYMGWEAQDRFYNFSGHGGRRHKSFSMNTSLSETPLGKAPRKTRAILNGLLTSKQLTKEGLNWLINATDPFHDEPLPVDGYPDLTTSSVLTQTLQLTTSVARPSTVPSTDLWDCHVFLNPCSPPLGYKIPGTGLVSADPRFYLSGITANGDVTQFSPFIFSGVNAIGCPNGTNVFVASGGQVASPALAIPQTFASGYFRLIACGFEVVNTTAELYKGGSVTCYKSPAYSQRCLTRTSTEPYQETTFCALPPGTQSDAALFPSSRTWGAADGCYIVCHLNDDDVPFVSNLPTSAAGLLLTSASSDLTTGTGNRLGYLPIPCSNTIPRTSPMNSPLPFDISGAVFSGLNPNSTLQVTVKYMIERIPAISEPNLLVLTRPPCPFDPLAIEMYSRITTILPVACKVSDNPDGEFWASILDALSAIAPIVGGAFSSITGPIGPAIGAAVSAGSNLGSSAIRQANAKKAKAGSYASPKNNKS